MLTAMGIPDKSPYGTQTHPQTSGIIIGRARRAVHAGPALWGAQNLPDAVFKKFFWGRGGPFGILACGPTATLLRHCHRHIMVKCKVSG